MTCPTRTAYYREPLPHLFTSRRRENGGPWTVICSWCAKPEGEA